MAQKPRSRNPNYHVQIINNTAQVNVVADLPQAVSLTGQSQFTTWQRMAQPIQNEYVTGGAAGTIMLKEFTKRIWVSSTGLGMTLPLIFDAETNSQEDVFNVAKALMLLERPHAIGSGPYTILLPPNPTRLTGNANVTSVRIGRMFFFESVSIDSVTANFDVKLDKYGFPIAGSVDFTFETDYVPSRDDLQRIMAGTVAPDF